MGITFSRIARPVILTRTPADRPTARVLGPARRWAFISTAACASRISFCCPEFMREDSARMSRILSLVRFAVSGSTSRAPIAWRSETSHCSVQWHSVSQCCDAMLGFSSCANNFNRKTLIGCQNISATAALKTECNVDSVSGAIKFSTSSCNSAVCAGACTSLMQTTGTVCVRSTKYETQVRFWLVLLLLNSYCGLQECINDGSGSSSATTGGGAVVTTTSSVAGGSSSTTTASGINATQMRMQTNNNASSALSSSATTRHSSFVAAITSVLFLSTVL